MTDFARAVTAAVTEMQRMIKHTGLDTKLPDIIAVSKRQPDGRIEEALGAGWRRFGENQIQEAETRWADRKALYHDLELHLVGPLQSNKVANAVALFDVFHALDREKIASKLASEMAKQNKQLRIFIQVNTGNEPQKSGVALEDLSDFVAWARDDIGLQIEGLMCLPPQGDDPALHFALLKKLSDRHALPRLSMGMSQDYGVAAAMGAHFVRLGTHLFGARQNTPAS